uniref:Uncharacterized protein MANES_15G192600 n=1 Tax=Rhizophora mucronata TaxID=61149 RepID=A0A2P2MZR5_RHIMU
MIFLSFIPGFLSAHSNDYVIQNGKIHRLQSGETNPGCTNSRPNFLWFHFILKEQACVLFHCRFVSFPILCPETMNQ